MIAIFQKNNQNYPSNFYLEYNEFIIEFQVIKKENSKCLVIDKDTQLALFEYKSNLNIEDLILLDRKPYKYDQRKIPLSFYIEFENEHIISEFEYFINFLHNSIQKQYIPNINNIHIFHYYNLLYKNKKITEIEYNQLIPFFINYDKDNLLNYSQYKSIDNKNHEFFKHIHFSLNDYNQVLLSIKYNPKYIEENISNIYKFIDKELILFFFKYYYFENLEQMETKEFKLFLKYIFEFIKKQDLQFEDDKLFLLFYHKIIKFNTELNVGDFKQREISYYYLNLFLSINLLENTFEELVNTYIDFNKGLFFSIESNEILIYQPYFLNIINKWKNKKIILKISKSNTVANTEMILLYQSYINNIITKEKFEQIIKNMEPNNFSNIIKLLEKYILIKNLKNF